MKQADRRKTSAFLRSAWKTLHRWLGLTGGAVLVLIGLTGSVNVFYREIDAALNPALYQPATPEQRIGVAEAMQAAAAVDPAPISGVTVPDRIWPVWIVTHAHPGQRLWTTMVDPSNGQVLGRRDTTGAFAYVVYSLHYTLLLRDWWGKELVGGIGIGLLLSALSGLYLWWPRPGRFWRSVSPPRGVSRQRRLMDLHNVAGFWSCTVLILIATTGVGVIYPGLIRPMIGLVSPATQPPSPSVPAPPETPRLSAEVILSAARAAYPDQAVSLLNPPTAARNTWRAVLKPVDANPALLACGALWLDPWTGRVVHERTWATMSNGNRYQTIQLWLHNGSVAGLPGRIVIFATGFMPLVLFASGCLVWRNRRQRQQALSLTGVSQTRMR